MQHRRVRLRQVVLDHGVKLRKRVIGHHREHVVLHMVVHVPIDEAAQRVHVDRAAVQPMVCHVVGEAAVLQQPGQHMMPSTVEPRQTDQHQRQDRTEVERERDRCGVDGKPDAGNEDRLRLFHFRDERRFLGADDAKRVANHVDDRVPDIENAEEVQDEAQEIRRPHDGDLGIAADDDRVCVVARVAPAPGDGIAHDHEAGDLVDGVVHPHRLERRSMPAFVPATIGGRAVENAIGEEERNSPPGAPEGDAEPTEKNETTEPDHGIADGGSVLTLHQFLHLLARDLRVIPLRR
ncbi:hypothetical protein D9M72_478040 [compost metagenome]